MCLWGVFTNVGFWLGWALGHDESLYFHSMSMHVLGSYSFWISLSNWMPVQNGCRSRCSLESQELARQRLPKVWHRRLSPVMFLNSCKAVVDSDQCRHVSTNIFFFTVHRLAWCGEETHRCGMLFFFIPDAWGIYNIYWYYLILYVIQCITSRIE